jgi:NADPH:quinone reductase-like Zn-dependent oxidoreductase
MRAVVHTRYGSPDVLRITDVERPTAADDEVLIRIHATTVNRTDTGVRCGRNPWFIRFFTGLFRPRRPILGSELAGVVEATGRTVTEFAVGDRVFGVKANGLGAHAEYVCMRERDALTAMPPGTSFEEAAALCDGAILALGYLRAAHLAAGDRILVYGASGAIGSAAVQLAKHIGAHVTAVCPTVALQRVRELGADDVIDYLTDDFTANGQTYDFVFDAVGKHSYRRCRRSIARGGAYLVTDLGFGWQNPLLALVTRFVGSRRVLFPLPQYTKDHVMHIKGLFEAGAFRPLIDRTYPFDDVVEATRYVETEQKIGNVVLTVTSG